MTKILVTIPYWNSKKYLKKTVRSILNQSYKDYEVLIVNDGDEESPRDFIPPHPKLKFFDLAENRGRYFIDAVCVMANPHEFYLPHDSDDESTYDRLFYLMRKQQRSGADAVFHNHKVVRQNKSVYRENNKLGIELTANLTHVAHHSALYKTQALKDVGSYHPDFRVGYDTLLVNLIKLNKEIAITPRNLYTRNIRPDSLITSPETGFGSPMRQKVIVKINRLYKKCFLNPQNTKQIITDSINPETLKEVKKEARRLRKLWT